MSDEDDGENQIKIAEVVELKRKPFTFYWVLTNLVGFPDIASLNVCWRNGPWKPGDCVKVTMEKVGESD